MNRDDLETALARLDEVWSARPGDADWAERKALVERITDYEDENVDIPLPDPVDAIQFRLEQDGLKTLGRCAMSDMVTQRILDEARAEIDRLREQAGKARARALVARQSLRHVLEMTVDSEDQMIMVHTRDAHDMLQLIIDAHDTGDEH